MAPGTKRKLSLPSTLLRELDIQQGGTAWNKRQRSRKDQRKDVRAQRKQARSSQSRRPSQPAHPSTSRHQKPSKQREGNGLPFSSDDELDEDDFDVPDEGVEEFGAGMDSDEEDGEDEEEDEEEEAWPKQPSKPKLSKSESAKIAEDEKEIAKLEKKLGLKGKKKLPKSFDEDGLGGLLEGLDDGDSDDDGGGGPPSKSKRKAEADEWLAQKRRKAEAAAVAAAASVTATVNDDDDDDVDSMDEDGFEDEDESEGDIDILSEDDDEDNDNDGNEEFGGFSETDEEEARGAEEPPRPQRENPYVAPSTNVAKYVPPSLRKQAGSNDQVEAQLRRRIQGLINRLTNDNMTGILKDVTDLYRSNPRQLVTSTLVDLIMALVCSPEKRPDSFFTMIAGFIAAVHKTMGVAVSAQFLQRLVETLERRSTAASGDQSDAESKHLVSLLAELYNMQVIACNLIFDYVRLFLQTLSELNTELLLRIIQLCGPSLRRDDPRALRDITNYIQPTTTKDTSVRTRFMIDEMKKLQSNKAKAAARNKDLAEQRTQLRKRIGTLKGTHDTQPLRVGLKDIQHADTQGKWWLVGASWLGNQETSAASKNKNDENEDEDDLTGEIITEVNDDLGIPDLWQLAREQGFNTEVRQRIFVALHAAPDCEGADLLVQKLRLNKHQRKEIAEVIVRSGERQNVYNHYYALLADRFSGDKELKFQFRRCLTIRFKKMGEDVDTGDGADGDDMLDETGDDEGVRWLFNTAKLFGFLVTWGRLRLVDVFKYRNLAALQEKAHVFTEVLLLTVLQECKGAKLKDVFGGLDADLDVGRGMQYFLERHVRGTQLVDNTDKKTRKLVRKRCDEVLETLSSALVRDDL